MELVDKTKKAGKNLELRIKAELTEDAGKPPVSNQLVRKDHPESAVATYTTKDKKVVSMSASQDAQESGDFEKAASKAGVKKDDLVYTTPGMAAAQAYVTENKENKDSEKKVLGEKAKLVKADEHQVPKSAAALFMDKQLDDHDIAGHHIGLHIKNAMKAQDQESKLYHHKQALDIKNHITGKKPYQPPVHKLDLDKSDDSSSSFEKLYKMCKSYIASKQDKNLYKSIDLDEIRARAHRAVKARRVNLHSGLDIGDKL